MPTQSDSTTPSVPAVDRAAHGSALAAKDFAITMAYDAFRLCLGNEPKNHTLLDVVRWMGLVAKVDIRECMNRDAAQSAMCPAPHEYNPHKKYPWFCRDCGYPPQDEVKHIQNPDWTPAAFLNTCGCEPMKEETKEALAAMITAAGDMMKPNVPVLAQPGEISTNTENHV